MDKVAVEVICFAGLRKYFGNGTTVLIEPEASLSDLIDEMISMKPVAQEVLRSSRIAVNEEFISLKEKIKTERTLFIVPPSSGG